MWRGVQATPVPVVAQQVEGVPRQGALGLGIDRVRERIGQLAVAGRDGLDPGHEGVLEAGENPFGRLQSEIGLVLLEQHGVGVPVRVDRRGVLTGQLDLAIQRRREHGEVLGLAGVLPDLQGFGACLRASLDEVTGHRRLPLLHPTDLADDRLPLGVEVRLGSGVQGRCQTVTSQQVVFERREGRSLFAPGGRPARGHRGLLVPGQEVVSVAEGDDLFVSVPEIRERACHTTRWRGSHLNPGLNMFFNGHGVVRV